MNNRKKKRNQIIMACTITAIVLFSVLGLVFKLNQTSLERTLSNSISMVEYYIIKKPIDFVSSLLNEYTALKDVYEENRILKQRLENYTSLEAQYNILQEEMDKLKEATDVTHLPSDYQTRIVGVQTRSQATWSDEIVIDEGAVNGIEEGMCVVDSQGLVGVVSSVSEISSTVSLITSENPENNIPVMIINGEETVYGLISGYDVNQNEINVILLTKVDQLEDQAKVYTSGLGGKSPKGIFIGTSKKLEVQSDGTTTVLTVDAAAKMEDLSYVTVVKRVTGNE